jgi:hypothetical protein
VLLASELSSVKGPVPLASVCRSNSSAASSDTMAMPLNAPICSSRFGVGSVSVRTTVSGSGAVMSATVPNR